MKKDTGNIKKTQPLLFKIRGTSLLNDLCSHNYTNIDIGVRERVMNGIKEGFVYNDGGVSGKRYLQYDDGCIILKEGDSFYGENPNCSSLYRRLLINLLCCIEQYERSKK